MHNLYNDTDTSNTPSNIILKLKDTGNLTDEEKEIFKKELIEFMEERKKAFDKGM